VGLETDGDAIDGFVAPIEFMSVSEVPDLLRPFGSCLRVERTDAIRKHFVVSSEKIGRYLTSKNFRSKMLLRARLVWMGSYAFLLDVANQDRACAIALLVGDASYLAAPR